MDKPTIQNPWQMRLLGGCLGGTAIPFQRLCWPNDETQNIWAWTWNQSHAPLPVLERGGVRSFWALKQVRTLRLSKEKICFRPHRTLSLWYSPQPFPRGVLSVPYSGLGYFWTRARNVFFSPSLYCMLLASNRMRTESNRHDGGNYLSKIHYTTIKLTVGCILLPIYLYYTTNLVLLFI